MNNSAHARSSRMILRPRGALSLLVAASLCGCADVDPGEDQSATALFQAAGTRLWTANSNVIPMCWATPGYTAEKRVIEEAIGRAWVAEANLTVTWRSSCPRTGTARYVKVQIGPHTQVLDSQGVLVWDHKTDGQTRPGQLGMATASAPTTAALDLFGTPGITVWVEPNGGSLLWQSRLEHVAVHEFGHVLGFQHEQNRPEAEARPCGPTVTSGTTVGPYDRDSIMNYCGSHGGAQPTLSAGDRSGVRQVYGARLPRMQWGTSGDHPLRADFDGDGRQDVAVYRPSTARFYIVESSTHLQREREVFAVHSVGDLPVPADYDGDRKADVAIWRRGGSWEVYAASASLNRSFGQAGDIPVPGDYDGDGRTELAVFRPSQGMWYTSRFSDDARSSYFWGAAGDVPVPADYDGDGRTDFAVYRPSTARWYVMRSRDGFMSLAHGTPTTATPDRPVPADYDNDGRADPAYYRASEGRWYYVRSSDGSTSWTGWGDPSDVPVPGDYNGDRRLDVTVWRPSNGTWYTTGALL